MQILIVDSDELSRQQTVRAIRRAGHQPLLARSAEHALGVLANHQVDMMLLDSNLPGIHAFDLIRTVRAQFRSWFPVLLISSANQDDYLAEGIHAGADDCLLKPLKEPLLSAKLSAMERISTMKRELDTANRQLRHLSTLDPLTGLSNRRELDSSLEREWCEQQQEGRELSVLMIDIDQFKAYNDGYGHTRGDQCLRQVSQILERQVCRSNDLLARFGGEEFIALLPDTSLEGAQLIAEQMLAQIRQQALAHQYSSVTSKVTISIGISSTRYGACNSDELIDQADQALYLAKDQGRNQQVSYDAIETLINNASSRPLAVG